MSKIPQHMLGIGAVMRGAGVLFVGTMATQVLTGLVYLFAARGVLPAVYGTAATTASIALLAVAILDFGGSTFALRERSSGRMSSRSLSDWIRSKSAMIAVTAPFVGCIAAWSAGDLSWTTIAFSALLFVGASLAMILGVPLRAQMRFGAIVTVTVASRLPSVGLILLLSFQGHADKVSLVALLALSSFLEAWFYVAASRLSGHERHPYSSYRWTNPFRGGVGVGISSAANSLGALDISLVRAVSGAAVAGEYAAVNRWMGPIGLTSQAVTQAVFPRMSAAEASGRGRGLASALWTVSLSVPVVGAIALSAPWLVPTFLGDAYAGSVVTLQLLCLAIVFSMACQPLSAALVAWRLELHAAGCVLGGLTIQLAAQGMGAHLYGSRGAAGGAVVGQFMTVVLLCLVLRLTKARWSKSRSSSEPTTILDVSGGAVVHHPLGEVPSAGPR